MATATDGADLPESPPRLPGYYDDTPHYRDRVDCRRRPVTEADAKRAIRRGDVVPNPADRPNSWRFVNDVDGMRITVAVGEDRKLPTMVKITAYVDVVDPGAAWQSDRWSPDEINVAAMLQALTGEDVPGYDVRRIVVDDDPVPYHGHRLVWNDGYQEPFCLSCQRSSVHGAEWEDAPCRA